jgi:hypothetical protein
LADGTNALWRGWACMPRVVQRDSEGLAAALAIHLSMYCAVGALFALVLYYLMQPTRLPNPGVAALKVSTPTLSYVESLRSEREAAKRGVVKDAAVKRAPEPETTGAAVRHDAPEAKPDAKKARAAPVEHRTRAARRPHPADTPRYAQQPYAQQPFSGGYQAMY